MNCGRLIMDSGDSESESQTSASDGSNYESRTGDLNCEPTETITVLKQTFELPKELCANVNVFNEFFSVDLWNGLAPEIRHHLVQKFLPKFPENDQEEKDITIQRLFNREPFRFGNSPLDDFQRNLEQGDYLLDMAKYKASIAKSERHEQRFQECERISRLAQKLVISRSRLLKYANNTPLGFPLKMDKPMSWMNSNLEQSAALRAKKRFFSEISSLSEEVGLPLSDDEASLEETHSSRKLKKHSNSQAFGPSSPSSEPHIFSTFSHKHSQSDYSAHDPAIVNEDHFQTILRQHKKRKVEDPDHPDLQTNDIKLHDVYSRSQISGSYRRQPVTSGAVKSGSKKGLSKIKQEMSYMATPLSNKEYSSGPILPSGHKPKTKSQPIQSNSLSTLDNSLIHHGDRNLNVVKSNSLLKSASEVNNPIKSAQMKKGQIVNMSKKDLMGTKRAEKKVIYPTNLGNELGRLPMDLDETDSLDMMADLNVVNVVPQKLKSFSKLENGSERKACFLSLIRDFFCSTPDHRMTLDDLNCKVGLWLSHPAASLNDWFLESDNWLLEVQSVIYFLVGEFSDQPEDYVPYVEYKIHLKIYQWIGAGRDTDQHLFPLCLYWMRRRNEMGSKVSLMSEKMERGPKFSLNNSTSSSEAITDGDDSMLLERAVSPPPPRCPTTWKVGPASEQEIEDFRAQERIRFDNPHMSFTYRMHGYESVVGPVKGIYTQVPGISKARGHNMLTIDRPNFVTILTLVRDATARLPNGEGTRADICELLKASQYLSPTAQENVLQTIVSGALDRMHTEVDPCVKFDSKRKLWIYLHRNRSQDEFDRLHQQNQGIGKHKKPIQSRKIKYPIPTNKESISPNSISQSQKMIVTPSLVKMNNLYLQTQQASATMSGNQQQNIVVLASPPHQNQKLSTIVKSQSGQNILKMGSSVNTTNNLQQIPALSSIQSISHSNQSTLISNSNQQNLMKAELVPISIKSQSSESKDIEANLDAQNPPNLIQKPLPTLFIDSGNKITKLINTGNKFTPKAGTILASNSPNQVKVSSASANQNRPMFSILTGSNQSILVSNQQQLRNIGGTVVQTVNKPVDPKRTSMAPPQLLINSGQTSIVSQQTGNAIKMTAHRPSTVNVNQTVLNRAVTPQKSRIQTVTSTASPAPGKSLINPAVIANNLSLQKSKAQQNVNQKQIQIGNNMDSNISFIGNVVKTSAGLTQVQQKQIFQNIIVQQQSPNQKRVLPNAVMVTTNQKGVSTAGGSPMKSIILASPSSESSNMIKIRTSNPTSSVVASNVVTTTASTLSKVSSVTGTPQILQIQQTSPSGKIQTVNASNLTPQQQQSIINTIRQQQSLIKTNAGQQQQSLIIKQHTVPTSSQIVPKVQQTITRIVKQNPSNQQEGSSSSISSNSSPVLKSSTAQPGQIMAKVLTNQSGQFVSLESFVGKQAVRMAKPGQANLIQLTTPGTPITQYAVMSPARNLISVSQPSRIVTNTQPGQSIVKDITSKPSPVSSTTGASGKVVQQLPQLVNTKVISVPNLTSQGGVRPKSSGIRMVNAANLNITHIGGKPVLIASKPGGNPSLISTGQQIQGVNQTSISSSTPSTSSVVIGGQTLKVQGNLNLVGNQTAGNSATGTQHVMFGNQIVKIQSANPQNITAVKPNSTSPGTKTVVLTSGQTFKVHPSSSILQPGQVILNSGNAKKTQMKSVAITPTTTTVTTIASSSTNSTTVTQAQALPQRVVLALQSGGQLILPSNFQGGSVNLKSLQGLKVIPVQQQQQQQQQNKK